MGWIFFWIVSTCLFMKESKWNIKVGNASRVRVIVLSAIHSSKSDRKHFKRCSLHARTPRRRDSLWGTRACHRHDRLLVAKKPPERNCVLLLNRMTALTTYSVRTNRSLVVNGGEKNCFENILRAKERPLVIPLVAQIVCNSANYPISESRTLI